MTTHSHRLLSYPQDAEAIEAAFATLDRETGGVGLYQSHAWFRHNVDGAAPPGCRGVRVLVIEREGTLIGLIPLTWVPSRIGRLRLESLMVPWHRGEASAVHCRPGANFPHLLPGIRRFLAREWPGWDALVWAKQLSTSSAWRPEGVWPGSLTVSVPTGASLTIPIGTSPEAFIGSLSVKARAGLRNARNRLKGHHIEYRVLEQPGPAMLEALEAFLVLEGRGWKQLTDERWPLFRALMDAMTPLGRFRIYQLLVDGQLAASLLALTGPPDRLSIYKTAYDEGQARLSPGRLLVYHVIEDASRRGTTRIVDMMSAAAWLGPWSPVPDPLRTLWCFRPTPRGLAGFATMAAWAAVGPAWRRLRRKAAT